MFDELWSEIQDAPGEIFDLDIPELKDEKFDINEYLNANYDYWCSIKSPTLSLILMIMMMKH